MSTPFFHLCKKEAGAIRSGVVFIPILLLFSHFGGILGIQLAQPAADLIASAVTVPFLVHFFRELTAMQRSAGQSA